MKLLIAGNGKIVDMLYEFIHEIKEIEIIGIVGRETSKDKLEARAQKEGIKKVYTDYTLALEDSDIDTVYVAMPNNFHYAYTKEALLHDKHVIVEKPFMNNVKETKEIIALAKEKQLLVMEGITSQFNPNYLKIKEVLPEIGKVRLVNCNHSQYSSRYDRFREGILTPAFDVNASGGALMDINLYNIYFSIGLFGKPERVKYFANIQRDIDTSGTAILQYDGFIVNCIGAKDCDGNNHVMIEGEDGMIQTNDASGDFNRIDVTHRKKDTVSYSIDGEKNRMYFEFMAFEKMYQLKDYQTCFKNLDKTLMVMEVIEACKKDAGIKIIG